MRTATNERAVFDASALIRALTAGDENAALWLDAAVEGRLRGIVPELVFAEVANALARYVRARRISLEGARAALRTLVALPLAVISMLELVEPGLEVALARGLSAYDACYAALAEASSAVLVTADVGLAGAVPGSALLPGAAPPV